MTVDAINKMCCPFDKHGLSLRVVTRDTRGRVIEGILSCEHCRRIFPVVRGVPILLPDEYRENEYERPILEQWDYEGDGE